MNLASALRLDPTTRLAITGAGGKTSALFRLGREWLVGEKRGSPAVWLGATTHLACDQLQYAGTHIMLKNQSDLDGLDIDRFEGVVLFTGAEVKEGRVSGVPLPVLDELHHLASQQDLPLIFEADGARRLPVKAPAEHEPVVTEWVDAVLVVAGLSALGKPLTAEWVHRPERFAKLCGLEMGSVITREALAVVLAHPEGGLKGIPPAARRMLLLNQASSEPDKAAANWIAGRLRSQYSQVLIANLAPPTGEGEIAAVHQKVAGILLAAGASSRMGQPKQLLLWRGQPLVRRAALLAIESGLEPVVVVTGNESARVAQALAGLPVVLVENPGWEAGQSSSVAAGIQALTAEVGAAIFLLADQPLVPAELVRSLVTLHSETMAPVVASLIDGRRSNPVLFDRQTFQELSRLRGDTGGRVLFSHYQPVWLPWHDASVNFDVDSAEDYQKLLELP